MAGISSAAGNVLLSADFEIPFQKPGSAPGWNGWPVEQGLPEVNGTPGRGGGAGPVMWAPDSIPEARLGLEAPWAGTPVIRDFFVLPMVDGEEKAAEMLDNNGAWVGFYREVKDLGLGRFCGFNRDGRTRVHRFPTDAVLPMDAAREKAARWVRLKLREDLKKQSRDLCVDGELSGAGKGPPAPSDSRH